MSNGFAPACFGHCQQLMYHDSHSQLGSLPSDQNCKDSHMLESMLTMAGNKSLTPTSEIRLQHGRCQEAPEPNDHLAAVHETIHFFCSLPFGKETLTRLDPQAEAREEKYITKKRKHMRKTFQDLGPVRGQIPAGDGAGI